MQKTVKVALWLLVMVGVPVFIFAPVMIETGPDSPCSPLYQGCHVVNAVYQYQVHVSPSLYFFRCGVAAYGIIVNVANGSTYSSNRTSGVWWACFTSTPPVPKGSLAR
jgi:hypothetical protein